ncbi:MAG: hypothetical protein L0Y79_11755 [Chlorobi bacterium]|nr:hypothetical protein [Chlorobiota bacterium]
MEHIVNTRLVSKEIPKGVIRRRYLLNKIAENINKNLTLICAPAGYGKTTLVQDFVAQNQFKYSWLHIHSDMDNFYTFIIYLLHSLQKLNPDFGKGTGALIEEYRNRYQLTKNLKRIVNDIITAFINEFSKHFSDEIIIVIDDLGNISSSEWQTETFNRIFENIPSNMHFIITSREFPKFSISVLQAKRNILKIEARELEFKYNEIEELISNIYKIKCSEEDINSLKENLSGWITGIHLVLQSYGSEFPKMRLDKIIILEDIFNYFTEDIFSNLEPETQEFLLFTSLLDSFSIELCNFLFKHKDNKKTITELLGKNIFIQTEPIPENGTEQSYSYQLLFKNFLKSKIAGSYGEKEIRDFYKKVSGFYSEKKDFLNAITCSLKAGENDKAIELIEHNFQLYFDNGSFEAIWGWFERIDDDKILKNPKLLYYKSLMLRYYKGDIEDSIPYLDKAIKIGKENEFLVKCYITKSRNLIRIGRINDAIKNLNEIIKEKTSNENKSNLNFLMAYAYYQNTEYDKSLPLLDKAAKELEFLEPTKEAKDIKLDIFNVYGHIYLIRGDYSKSISYYEQVAKKSEQIIQRYETLCNLILLYSQSGRFEKALNYLNDAREIADKISNPIFNITYLLSYQALKFEFGDYEESIKLLEEMNKIAVSINHKYYIYLSYSLIGDSYYYLNKLSKAEEHYDLAFKYINEESEFEKIQYSVMKAELLKKGEIVPEIENVLLEAYEYYNLHKLIYTKTQTAFQLADYYFRTSNPQTSLKYLSEAINTSNEKEYVSFLQRDFEDFRYLFDFSIANGIQKDFLKILIGSVLNKKNAEWISPESRKRFENLNGKVYDIQLKTFGKGEIFVRNRLIEESDWSKKKWKTIFIYLLLSPKKEMTKDKIIDLFFADTPMESAENIFHQIVSKFRGLIKIEPLFNQIKKKAKQKKSKSEPELIPPLIAYEDKLLKVNSDFNFYIDSNEFENLYKICSIEKDTERRIHYTKEAITLYSGDFLEGNYETWAEELRVKFKNYFISMSEDLIIMLFDKKDYDEAVVCCEKLLKYDPLNLTAYENLITSYENLDKHNTARESYSKLIKNYEEEYGEKLPASFTS